LIHGFAVRSLVVLSVVRLYETNTRQTSRPNVSDISLLKKRVGG
jgi:hypothetical protein